MCLTQCVHPFYVSELFWSRWRDAPLGTVYEPLCPLWRSCDLLVGHKGGHKGAHDEFRSLDPWFWSPCSRELAETRQKHSRFAQHPWSSHEENDETKRFCITKTPGSVMRAGHEDCEHKCIFEKCLSHFKESIRAWPSPCGFSLLSLSYHWIFFSEQLCASKRSSCIQLLLHLVKFELSEATARAGCQASAGKASRDEWMIWSSVTWYAAKFMNYVSCKCQVGQHGVDKIMPCVCVVSKQQVYKCTMS